MARRKARRIDAPYIRRVLAWYLERHDAPRAHIRRLMMQRVRRAVSELDQDREEAIAAMEQALDDFVRHGMIDDRRWAENSVRTWRQRGVSGRQVRARLAAKGVGSEIITEVLTSEEDEDPERLAALRYARRRCFGPWRRHDAPEGKRDKELAAMARAGFSFGMAKEILDDEDRDGLEDEIFAHR